MIFDVRQDAQGMAWVIMEYVSGPSLREILDEAESQKNSTRLGETGLHGIGVEQATYFLRELCKGLTYLHDAGVVHRDLKPHNVFFEDGVVKIGDYSLSKAIATSHRSGHTTTVGSVHYMAPEISEGRYDKTVDIYALGVMLFEMLTGAPPYDGQSMGEVLMKHLSSQPDVSRLPEPFDRVVAKAMHRDPDQRYQSASEMMRALSPADELEYSRPPASLSLIGERAAQQRVNRVPAPASLADTFATPVALRDTHDEHDSMPFERPGTIDLNSLGLRWQRTTTKPLAADSTWLVGRFLIAMFVCLSLISLGCVFDGNANWHANEAVPLSIVVLLFSSFACWFFLATMPRETGWLCSVQTRFIAAAIGTLLFLISGLAPPHLESEEYFSVVFAMILVSVVMDFRCFLSADRYPRISLAKTLIAGSIAMVCTALIDQSYDRFVFAGAIAVTSTIVIQLLAPHGRTLNGSEANSAVETNRLGGAVSEQKEVLQPTEAKLNEAGQSFVSPSS